MAIISFVFVSIIIIRLSLYEVNGSNVCLDRTGKSICCFNYEEVNGECVECTRGSTSWDGGPCLSCKDNRYGIKCLKTCRCNYLHRCDPVVGCIKVMTTSERSTTVNEAGEPDDEITKYVHVTKTTLSQTYEDNKSVHTETGSLHITVDTLSHNDNYYNEYAHTEISAFHITVDTLPQNDGDKTILSGGWIFSICIIGIVLLVCVPILIWKYSLTKKLQIQGTHARDKDRHNDQAVSLQHHEYIDVENEYEEIDDNAIVGIVCQMQHSKETVSINSKSSSERSYIEPENNGSYLYPCHIPDDELEGRKSSDDSNNSSFNKKDRSDYLNPYQSLQQSSERIIHVYERNSFVHKTPDEGFYVASVPDLNIYRMSVASIKGTINKNISSPVLTGHKYMTLQMCHPRNDCNYSKRHVQAVENSKTLVNNWKSVPVALDMTSKRFGRNRGPILHRSNEYF